MFYIYLYIYIYKTVVSDRVLTLYRPCAYPGAVLRLASGPTGPDSPEFGIIHRCQSNPLSPDRRNHGAPESKPNPASPKPHLTRTLLWTCTKAFPKIGQYFSHTFVGRTVSTSRICRVKKFQNPTVHVAIVSPNNPHTLSTQRTCPLKQAACSSKKRYPPFLHFLPYSRSWFFSG